MVKADELHPIRITEFKHGLQSAEPPTEILPGSCVDTNNMWLTRSGALGVRRGFNLIGPTAHPAFKTATAMNLWNGLWYLGITNTNVYAGRPTGSMVPIPNYAPGASTVLPQLPGTIVFYASYALIFNQTGMQRLNENQTATWTREAWPAGPGPIGQLACLHHSRLFVAGNDDAPQTILYCLPGDPFGVSMERCWPNTYSFHVADITASPITHLCSYNGTLYVFTARRVIAVTGYQWHDQADIVVQDIPAYSGCIATRSVVATPRGVFYVGRDGVYVVTRNVERISDTVRDQFVGRDLSWCSAVGCDDFYAVTLPNVADPTKTDALLVFDLRHKSWTRWDIKPNCFFGYLPEGQYRGSQFAFQNSDGLISAYGGSTTDNGLPIPLSWSSSQLIPSADPGRHSDIQQVWLAAACKKNVNVHADWIWDYGSPRSTDFSLLKAENVTSQWRTEAIRLGGIGHGSQLQVKLEATPVDDLAIQMLSLEAKALAK